jgi:hypothetical protein
VTTPTDGRVTIYKARIINRNFAGKEDLYNAAGVRNFGVLLDEQTAQDMLEDGWNVKHLRVREEGDIPQAFIQVGVSYKTRPPRVFMITSKGRTELTEDMIDMLDYADIKEVDLIFTPYRWVIDGKGRHETKTGIKAYLKSMYVMIEEDELDLKYRDIEDIPTRSGKVDE